MVLTRRRAVRRTRIAPLAVAAGVTAACALSSASARASGEVWVWYEHQVRLHDPSPALPRVDLRVMSNARFSGRSDGLELMLVRVGPILHAAPWLAVATHATAVASRTATRAFQQEYRWEIDLVPHFRVGDVIVLDRNRFAYINRPGAPFNRYRQMLQLTYAPKGAKWMPFAFHEMFFPITKPELAETWTALGVGRSVGGVRVDLAYMLRARFSGSGETDHVAWLAVVLPVPEPKRARPRPARDDDRTPEHETHIEHGN